MSYNAFESRSFNSIMLFCNEVFNILAHARTNYTIVGHLRFPTGI